MPFESMIILGIILFLFVSFIVLLLWTPLRLIVDSKKDVYKVEWQHIITALLMEHDSQWGVQIQFLFVKKFIPLKWFLTQQKKVASQETHSTPSVSGHRMWSILKKIIASFDVKICRVNWDTGDYLLNAYLYPFTPFLFHSDKFFKINFMGKKDIELVIENRIGRILKSFINF